jgi:hypothetical protein
MFWRFEFMCLPEQSMPAQQILCGIHPFALCIRVNARFLPTSLKFRRKNDLKKQWSVANV